MGGNAAEGEFAKAGGMLDKFPPIFPLNSLNCSACKGSGIKIKKIQFDVTDHNDLPPCCSACDGTGLLPRQCTKCDKIVVSDQSDVEQCPNCGHTDKADSWYRYIQSFNGLDQAKVEAEFAQLDPFGRRLAGPSPPALDAAATAMGSLSLALLSAGLFLGGFLCFRCFRKRRRIGPLPRYNGEES